MKKFTYESAQENFDEMMEHAQEGLYVIVVGKDGREYSLRLDRLPVVKERKAGGLKGMFKMADDFDAPLPEMAPYME